MRKIILYIAISLDGFIADAEGDIMWLHEPEYENLDEGEDMGYSELMNRIDTTIMGNKSMEKVLSFDVPFPYQNTTNYVITRNPENKSHPNAIYTSDWKGTIKSLKNSGGKDIWLIGGGEINGLLLNENMVDELVLTVVPSILGKGKSLFPTSKAIKKMKLIGSKTYSNGMVQIKYEALS